MVYLLSHILSPRRARSLTRVLDTGASDLIAKGNIKLKSSLALKEYTPSGVILSDGTEHDVDLVVLATG